MHSKISANLRAAALAALLAAGGAHAAGDTPPRTGARPTSHAPKSGGDKSLKATTVKSLRTWDEKSAFFTGVRNPVLVLAQSPSSPDDFRGYGVDCTTEKVTFAVDGSRKKDFKKFLAQIEREMTQVLLRHQPVTVDWAREVICLGIHGSPYAQILPLSGQVPTGSQGGGGPTGIPEDQLVRFVRGLKSQEKALFGAAATRE